MTEDPAPTPDSSTGGSAARPPRLHDFEAALARELEEGEAVEGIWQVSPLRYGLGLIHVSRFLKLGAIPALIGAAYLVVWLSRSSREFWQGWAQLPTDPTFYVCAVVAAPVLLFCVYMAVTETLRVVTGRYALTARRWIAFESARGEGWRARSIPLARCAWRLEPPLLFVYEKGKRGRIRECLPTLGLDDAESLRRQLTEHAGAELERDAARALERQFEERNTPVSALVPVFRGRTVPDWSARIGPTVVRPAAGAVLGRLLVYGTVVGILLSPATVSAWAIWAAVTAGFTLIDLARRELERRHLAPRVFVARGHWWVTRRGQGLAPSYAVSQGLPLGGLRYVVHDGAVHTPTAPAEVLTAWTIDDVDTTAELAAAVATPDPGPFSAKRWHRLHPATRSLLRALDAAGARRDQS